MGVRESVDKGMLILRGKFILVLFQRVLQEVWTHVVKLTILFKSQQDVDSWSTYLTHS